MLCRKLKLLGSGEHVTLFLRTTNEKKLTNNRTTLPLEVPNNLDDLMNAFPTTWPYCQTTQPLLLEYEDADRKIYLVPLLPLLSAIPPPQSSPALIECDNSTRTPSHDTNNKKYRIPSITIHAAVSKFLCRGADLMKSGIRSFPPPWELRQSKGVVSITVFGNPQVLAVGFIENSLLREYCYKKQDDWRSVACNLVGPDKKGVGVNIVSCYGDDLWKSSQPVKVPDLGVVNTLGGGRYDDGDFGNVGFQNGCVVCPLATIREEDIRSDEGDDVTEIDDSCDAQVKEGVVVIEQLNISEQSEAVDEAPPIDSQHKAASEIDHDVILEAAFYTSLIQLLVSKTTLPMPVSTYSAKHLMAAVPESGPRLDMKQTTYKKIGPFLLEMESQGVIKLGSSKDKKDRCAFLVGIDKQHPELVAFKRQWKKDAEESGHDPTTGNDQKRKLAVVDLFVVPRHISDRMQLAQEEVKAMNAKTQERRGTGFLTKTECRAIIDGYIESEGLVDPKNKGKILVNGPLCDALYRPSKKNKTSTEDTSYPTSVTRKDLIDLWMSKMDAGHAIVEMPGSRILNLAKGEPKPVDIEVEFRQGNKRKFLTRIRGMEEYSVDAELLSNDVSQRFACSSSVETNPVGRAALKKGRAELVFQGIFSLFEIVS